VAIDDFGAGYAGLSLLADFQPDMVKLDMHLVRGIDIKGRARRSCARSCKRTTNLASTSSPKGSKR